MGAYFSKVGAQPLIFCTCGDQLFWKRHRSDLVLHWHHPQERGRCPNVGKAYTEINGEIVEYTGVYPDGPNGEVQ